MEAVAASDSATLFEVAEGDLDEVAAFISGQSGEETAAQAARRLRWLLLENPAREPGMPLGWGLRSASGELVGSLCCAPQRFRVGDRIFTLMMATAFYVDPRHPARGGSLFQRFSQLGRRHALFTSSANALSGRIWRGLGGYPIGHADHELLGILRPGPVLEEALARRIGAGAAARAIARAGAPLWSLARRFDPGRRAPGELRPLGSAEDFVRLDAGVYPPALSALRDVDYVRWRYFSPVDPATAVFCFESPRAATATLVAVGERARGHRRQVPALNVLGVYGQVDAEALQAIAVLLAQRYRDRVAVVRFRCLGPAGERALRAGGFLRRSFAAPIAWCLDRFALLPTREWHLVPADGDMMM